MGFAAQFSANADNRDVDFSYVHEGEEAAIWGTKKLENYDVAIRIDVGGLAGSKITGFRVPIVVDAGITGYSAWISEQLRLDANEQNVPDFKTRARIDAENQMLVVELAEPYVMTRNAVYVGYSFRMTALNDKTALPLKVTRRSNPDELDGFWLHTSRTYRKWRTFDNRQMTAPIYVTIEGDFYDDCLSLNSINQGMRVEANTPFKFEIAASNFGIEEIKDLDYSYVASDGRGSGSGHYTFREPIPGQFGSKGSFEVNIDPIDAWGKTTFEVTVDKINGKENLSPNKTISTDVTLLGFAPVTRLLMEEYTSLWCGFCPRGFIGLERMAHLYPETFVGMSFHTTGMGRDALASVSEYPSKVSGLPAAILNRTTLADPYYGTSRNKELGVEDDMKAFIANPAVADIEAHLSWKDDSHKEILCTSIVRFTDDMVNPGYKIAYAILADGITKVNGRDLPQSNYFAGDETLTGDDWDVFTKAVKDEKVTGLVFNDIVAAFSDQLGVEGSVPENIKYGERYFHTYTYSLPLTNVYKQILVEDPTKIRCVAILLDHRGAAVNCAKSPYIGTSGIGTVELPEADVVSTTYVDLQGRTIARPQTGQIVIRLDRLSNGTVLPSKIVY